MPTAMPYRPLGICGTKVSALSLGGWTTFGGSVRDLKVIETVLHRAYEDGVNFFDIADVYARGESESVMGRVLREFPRHRLLISSKVFFPMSEDPNDRGLSRKHIMESIDKSLKRVGTDYLDIYFCHRFDDATPLEETIRAMDDLVHQGKILYWGTSEWTSTQLQEAHQICRDGGFYRPQVEQPQYNLFERERVEKDVVPFVDRTGMGLVTWSPLASGLLTGKYDHGIPPNSRLSQMDWLKDRLYNEANIAKVRQMKELADELHCSRSQLALAWLLNQKGISSVITGATSLQQLEDNLGALRVNFSADVDAQLKKLFPATSVI